MKHLLRSFCAVMSNSAVDQVKILDHEFVPQPRSSLHSIHIQPACSAPCVCVWSLSGKTLLALLQMPRLSFKSVRAVLRALNVEVGVVVVGVVLLQLLASGRRQTGNATPSWLVHIIIIVSVILKTIFLILSIIVNILLCDNFVHQAKFLACIIYFCKSCSFRRPKYMYPSKLGKENSSNKIFNQTSKIR